MNRKRNREENPIEFIIVESSLAYDRFNTKSHRIIHTFFNVMDWLVDFVTSSYYAVCIHLLGLFLAKYSLALTLVACVCQFHRTKETQIIYSKYGHILTKISIPLYSDTHLCMLIGCTANDC